MERVGGGMGTGMNGKVLFGFPFFLIHDNCNNHCQHSALGEVKEHCADAFLSSYRVFLPFFLSFSSFLPFLSLFLPPFLTPSLPLLFHSSTFSLPLSPSPPSGLPSSDVPARRFEDEDEVDGQASIYVKYDRLLHGEKRFHKGKREVLTIKFLKKFIHYAKGRTPKLTEEVRRGSKYFQSKECVIGMIGIG